MTIVPAKDSDVFLWPDGTWCFRHDLLEYQHMGDDYRVIPEDSDEWEDFFE